MLKTLKKGDLIIDISKHNGVVNYEKVKAAGVKAVIIKSTEGATVTDKMVFKNAAACKAAGLPISFYHFATWNNENEVLDAETEARHFMAIVKAAGTPDLPLVLDIESNNPIPYTHKEMVDYVGTFIETVGLLGGDLGIIYGSPGFLNSYLPANHPFTNKLLWVADYTGAINPVPGWKTAWLRQTTDKGKVDGVNGACDLNYIQ